MAVAGVEVEGMLAFVFGFDGGVLDAFLGFEFVGGGVGFGVVEGPPQHFMFDKIKLKSLAHIE